MDSGELLISTDALIRIFLFLLYVPVGLISYWRLIPRLTPAAKRLASGMLAAQVLVIILSLELRPSSNFGVWLWHFHEEWNIPATLAFVQLGLVGSVALVTAWLAKARPNWQRLYLTATGLVFMFLGLDEYLALHEIIDGWEIRYITLGAGLVAATLLVALRSPRRERIWHICLLTGLAMSVVGAMLFNALPTTCGNLGFLQFDGCLQFFLPEESLEFLGIWLTLVAILGMFSEAVPRPQRLVRQVLFALPALWIVILFLNSLVPRLELWLLARPASIEFETDVSLHGYRIDSGEEVALLRLYASAKQEDYMGLGYSIHLVDQATGESVAGRDDWADRQHGFWFFGPNHAPLYRQWLELAIPPQAPVNRALWVVLTLWRKERGAFVSLTVLNSDQQLLNDTQVVLGELVMPAVSATSTSVPLANFDNGFALDAVELPEHARAGETLIIPFSWRSDVPGQEDHVQFLHFGHEESSTWWVYDQQPLGPRLPTHLWYSGLADSEIWQVPLPADLAPGRYTIFTGLYRTRDSERVPASDAGGTPWLDARVPLGILFVER